jgi:hypothetical protein
MEPSQKHLCKFFKNLNRQISGNMVPKCAWTWTKPHNHLTKLNVHWSVGHAQSITTNAIQNNVRQIVCHVRCHLKYNNDILWLIFLHLSLGFEYIQDSTYNRCGQVLLAIKNASAFPIFHRNQWKYNFQQNPRHTWQCQVGKSQGMSYTAHLGIRHENCAQ